MDLVDFTKSRIIICHVFFFILSPCDGCSPAELIPNPMGLSFALL